MITAYFAIGTTWFGLRALLILYLLGTEHRDHVALEEWTPGVALASFLFWPIDIASFIYGLIKFLFDWVRWRLSERDDGEEDR
jgi:hypothetical protein